MKLFTALVISTLLNGAVHAQEGTPAGAEMPATQAAESILIVTSAKAEVRTLPDRNGPSVMQPVVGQVLRQSGAQRAAFLPVVAPGGFAVWIFGRNLKETATEGVLQVTANAVNQRPMASSANKSYPLRKRLHSGDLVRVIGRLDEAKPMAEDWIQVWSSADSVGWILAVDCSPVKADGEAMWSSAMAELGSRAATENKSGSAVDAGSSKPAKVAPTPAAPAAQIEKVSEALDLADASVTAARALESVDLSAERKVYEQAIAQKVSMQLTKRAQTGLELIGVIELAKGLESDLENAKRRRVELLLARQKQQWDDSRRRDPTAGRFDARGVLERRSVAGKTHSYVLRWGSELVCEVRDESGRYDLDRFAGFELGLKGTLDYADATAILEAHPVLTVERLEILAKR